MKRTAPLLVLCLGLIAERAALAAPGDPRAVRDSVRRLLRSPDFRKLERLKRKRGAPLFRRGGGGDTLTRDSDGRPVIPRDEEQRGRIGRDADGKAVLGKDENGDDVRVRDEEGREVVVRDEEERGIVGRDKQGRPIVVRDGKGRAVIEKDRNGRALIGRDERGRDVVARDDRGREFVVRDFKQRDVVERDAQGRPVVIRDGRGRRVRLRDEDGRPVVPEDDRGRPVLFRDENRRTVIDRDPQGRAVAGRDERGRPVRMRDGRGRDVMARDEGDGRIIRDERGRPILFRDDGGRAKFRRDEDGRAVIGRDEDGREVRIRDDRGRNILARDERDFRNGPRRGEFGGPPDGRDFGGNDGPGGRDAFGNPPDNRGFGGRNGGGNDAGPRDVTGPDRSSDGSSAGMQTVPLTGAGNVFAGIAQALGWVVAAIVIAVMLFLVVRGIIALVAWYQDRERDLGGESAGPAVEDPLEPDRSPGEFPADVYVAKARELAAAGRFREAVAHLLLGGMSYLERAGLVRYRKGLTHRDYVRAVRPQQQYYRAMRQMVRVYEPLGFGRRTPASSHFEQSLAAYESAFRAAPVAKG